MRTILTTRQETAPVDKMLSRHQLAETLGVSLATIDRLRKRPDFPPSVRVGRSVRWWESDIARWFPGGPAHADRPGRRSSAEELMT